MAPRPGSWSTVPFPNADLTDEDDNERDGRWDQCEDAASGYG
jgi:hypothetical protein